MKYIVRNWRQFQHYKDRNPPWIKLHFSLLSSRDWVSMNDASRVLAVVCMLIASRNEGQIDGSEAGLAYLQRVAYLNKKPDLKPLIESGFLESASKPLALAHTNARPETEDLTEDLTETSIALSDKSLSAADPPKNGNAVAYIPLANKTEWGVSAEFLKELEAAYPAVDGPATLREIRVWCLANPRKCKTRGGVLRFVNAWFSKEQNKG